MVCPRTHDSSLSLHWLPVQKRVDLVLAFKAFHNIGAPYISNRVQHYATSRTLRSSTLQLSIVLKFNRSRMGGVTPFQVVTTKLWNSLQSSETDIGSPPLQEKS